MNRWVPAFAGETGGWSRDERIQLGPGFRRRGDGRASAGGDGWDDASQHHQLCSVRRLPSLKTSVALLLALALSACARQSAAVPDADRLPVIAELPHDREAYTQGFLFHDGSFYESTGLSGASSLRRVDIATGSVQARVDLDSIYFGEGLAVLGDRAYQLTWRNRIAFVYDVDTFELLGSHEIAGEGWGLTTDGTYLILSDGTYLLRFLDPATFEVVRTLQVTADDRVVNQLNELEWVRGEIWANIYLQDRIARIDPGTGAVTGWVSTEGLLSRWERLTGAEVANGIAYDSIGDRLWVTGKLWPKVFQVERPE